MGWLAIRSAQPEQGAGLEDSEPSLLSS